MTRSSPKATKSSGTILRNVTLSRPDRLRIDTERSDGARSLLVFDGKEITIFDESTRTDAQASHPGSMDSALVYFVQGPGYASTPRRAAAQRFGGGSSRRSR